MKTFKWMILILATTGVCSAFAEGVSSEMEGASKALGANLVSEVSFDQGSASLNETTRAEIRDLIKSAKDSGKKINKVQIAAWADREYPAKDTKASKGDVQLAERRLKEVRTFMQNDLKVNHVASYNMTKRPNALQKLLNTPENKTKKALEANGAAPVTTEDTGLFGQRAQSSKAVLLIYLE